MGHFKYIYDCGLDNLIEAIFAQAKTDYISACVTLKKRPNNTNAHRLKNDVERFFSSSWAMELAQSEIPYEKVMRHLNKEAETIIERRSNDRVYDQDNEERS